MVPVPQPRLRVLLGLLGVSAGRVVTGEAARLEDARLAVTEERITCDLALGRHGEVAGELTGLAARSRRPASRADSAGNPR
jgi:hypothetical protein